MKIKTLQEILKYKSLKKEFAILTNLKNGDSEIFIPNKIIKGEFSKYLDEIKIIYKSNKNGILENDKIFVQTCKNPIKVIIKSYSPLFIPFKKNSPFLSLDAPYSDPHLPLKITFAPCRGIFCSF